MKEFIANYITPLLVLVTAVFGFINNQRTAELDHAVKQIELRHKISFDSLLRIEKLQQLEAFDRDFKFKIYSDVKEAVLNGDEKVQFVTVDFVTYMVEDEAFKEALLKSLGNARGTSEKVKEEIGKNLANENTFRMQQQSLKAEWNDYAKNITESINEAAEADAVKIRVDIFYLEETSDKYNSKQKAQTLLQSLDPNKYELRLRLLPKLTNAKSGYRINQNQIRFEQKEAAVAKAVQQTAGEGFVLNQIAYNTPNYISVFVYD